MQTFAPAKHPCVAQRVRCRTSCAMGAAGRVVPRPSWGQGFQYSASSRTNRMSFTLETNEQKEQNGNTKMNKQKEQNKGPNKARYAVENGRGVQQKH